jgi:hypothetical protein
MTPYMKLMPPVPVNRYASILTILTASVIYLFVGGFYAERGMVNADEGFYAYASFAVMQGQVPYRDFAYTQMPVLPYLQGAVMSFSGFGIRQQRWVNVCLGALSLALGIAMWNRLKLHPVTSWALIMAWCSCGPLIYYNTIGKTYAMAQLLIVATGGCLLLKTSPGIKLLLLSLAGTLTLGCRLTMAPAVLILWIGLVVLHRKQMSWLLLLCVPLLTVLVILGPFFFADPLNAIYWNWTYHLQSIMPPHDSLVLLESFYIVPAIALLVIVGISILACKRETLRTPAGWIFLAGLIGWLLSVSLPATFIDYAIPCLPLLIVGFGLLLKQVHLPTSALGLGSLILLAAITVGVVKTPRFIAKGYLEAVDRTVGFVQANTKPTDVILTSMPEIPLEAGHPIFPGLELGKFAVTAEMDDKTADDRKIITFNQLFLAIERRSAPVIVLSGVHSWNFGWSIPSIRPLTPDYYLKFAELLLRNYDCVGANEYFLVFKIHDPLNHALKVDAHQL